jgi:fructose-bisphosphate aldolase, class I
VILFDETLRQTSADGRPFAEVLASQGILPGIKVDRGAKALAGAAGEKVTEGLDGLRDRLVEYRGLGARFAKWRAVFKITDHLPSDYCIDTNAHALARYAALCQEEGLVPIVEPEVLMDGAHGIDRCEAVSTRVLHRVFGALFEQRTLAEGMLLKPNMVLAGTECPLQPPPEAVAEATLRCLRRTVPAAVPGVVFLSGGQSDELATARLNAMNRVGEGHPWEISFSFSRALHSSALESWKGEPARVAAAKRVFAHRVRCNGLARRGQYSEAMEGEALG